VSIVDGYTLVAPPGAASQGRPDSRWLPMADPGDAAGRVDDLVAIVQRIAVGERIPLHVHRSSELIFVHGPGRARLGDMERDVEDGAVMFVRAGVPHALVNRDSEPLALEAVFPGSTIWIHYLDPDQPPMTLHVRTGAVTPDPG
jgi:quercetin dioxygenase-like cupin family protein